jgi:hypothetical protein
VENCPTLPNVFVSSRTPSRYSMLVIHSSAPIFAKSRTRSWIGTRQRPQRLPLQLDRPHSTIRFVRLSNETSSSN